MSVFTFVFWKNLRLCFVNFVLEMFIIKMVLYLLVYVLFFWSGGSVYSFLDGFTRFFKVGVAFVICGICDDDGRGCEYIGV